MVTKCCNPKCEAPFDYRQGRLIRMVYPADGTGASNYKVIKHFWICGKCTANFVLKQDGEAGVTLQSRKSEASRRVVLELTSAA